MTNFVPCMGGWCRRRDECAHYIGPHAHGLKPAERLCAPGFDDPELIRGRRFDSWLAGATSEQAAAWLKAKEGTK